MAAAAAAAASERADINIYIKRYIIRNGKSASFAFVGDYDRASATLGYIEYVVL